MTVKMRAYKCPKCEQQVSCELNRVIRCEGCGYEYAAIFENAKTDTVELESKRHLKNARR